MQYCRRISSRVDGRLVGRVGVFVLVVVRVGFGSGVCVRSVVLVLLGRRVGCWVGRRVGARVGTGVVVGTRGGVTVGRVAAGVGVVLDEAVGDGDCCPRTFTAASSELPPNRPIADTAQRLTARKSARAAPPAYTTRRDGPPY
jgi:hypothetical protein